MKVTEVTRNATQDNLTPNDYRDIYQELRGHDETTGKYAMSLDKFVAAIKSAYSKAAWSKYHRGAADLNRNMRNELRCAVGVDLLPPTVTEVTSAIDADALIAQYGEAQANRALLVGSDVESATVYVNGDFTVVKSPQDTPVTTVTGPSRSRKPRKQVQVAEATHKRLIALREAGGYPSLDAMLSAWMNDSET